MIFFPFLIFTKCPHPAPLFSLPSLLLFFSLWVWLSFIANQASCPSMQRKKNELGQHPFLWSLKPKVSEKSFFFHKYFCSCSIVYCLAYFWWKVVFFNLFYCVICLLFLVHPLVKGWSFFVLVLCFWWCLFLFIEWKEDQKETDQKVCLLMFFSLFMIFISMLFYVLVFLRRGKKCFFFITLVLDLMSFFLFWFFIHEKKFHNEFLLLLLQCNAKLCTTLYYWVRIMTVIVRKVSWDTCGSCFF